LPNEPILASQAFEITDLRSQMRMRNEAATMAGANTDAKFRIRTTTMRVQAIATKI
jgi:pyridoxine/pyridoxamine 5'-phosphate oxidase